MIVQLSKYLFFGSRQEIDAFFIKAQKLGIIEFIAKNTEKKSLPENLERMLEAIQEVKKLSPSEGHFPEDLNAHDLSQEILFCRDEIEHLYEEKRALVAEIEKVAPFGDFAIEDIREMEASSPQRMIFYAGKHNSKRKLDPSLIYISTNHDLDYFISLTPHSIKQVGLYEVPITHSLSTLQHQLDVVTKKIQSRKLHLRSFAKYLTFLKEEFTRQLDVLHLKEAKNDAHLQLDQSIFFIQGWIPKKYVARIRQMTKQLNVIMEEIAIEQHDKIPTYMENKGFAAIGEDLVNIYDVPSTTDKDPSTWVFISFAIFFAMIISDAGYGLIYLLASIFFQIKFRRAKAFAKRMIKLTRILAFTCIIWGVLTTSFFGIEFHPNNPLAKFSLTGTMSRKKMAYTMHQKNALYDELIADFPDLKTETDPQAFLSKATLEKEGKTIYVVQNEFNSNALLEIALLVGVIHISLSLLRNIRRNYSGLGWALFVIGGYLYAPKILDATSLIQYMGIMSSSISYPVGLQILCTGFVLALGASMVQNGFLKGLAEIFKMIEVFADVLSYLRLYALGLASLILASTFNGLGMDAGLFFGALIIALGHVTNITLGIMGGVIHGLRLNFLEWYHHCFEGGGKKFNPLKLFS